MAVRAISEDGQALSANQRSRNLSRRIFLSLVAAGGAYVVADAILKGPLSTLSTGKFTVKQVTTASTASLTSSTSTIISKSTTLSATSPSEPVNMLVLYKSDFETGSFQPEVFLNQDRINGATCDIVTDIVRERRYACKCTVTNPTPIVPTGLQSNKAMINFLNLRSPNHAPIREAYYAFSVYLPSTLNGPYWIMPFQIMQKDSSTSDTAVLVALKARNFPQTPDGVLKLYLAYDGANFPDQIEPWHDSAPLELGRWHDFIMYFLCDQNGRVILWQNGVLKCDVSYNTTYLNNAPNPYPLAGMYQDERNPANWCVIDRIVVASTLDAATTS